MRSTILLATCWFWSACAGSSTDASSDQRNAIDRPGNENEPMGSDSDPSQRAGSQVDEPSRMGGSTEDFTGNLVACLDVTEVQLDEMSPLGFSPESVLAFSTGNYAIDIRWVSCASTLNPCGYCAGSSSPAFASPLDDTDTVLSLSVEPTGAPARVEYEGSAGRCAEQMFIPVIVQLDTADGAMAEQFEAELWTEAGTQTMISRSVAASELSGTLPTSAALPEDALAVMTFGFYDDMMWLEVYVYASQDAQKQGEPPILEEVFAPYMSCSSEIEQSVTKQ